MKIKELKELVNCFDDDEEFIDIRLIKSDDGEPYINFVINDNEQGILNFVHYKEKDNENQN